MKTKPIIAGVVVIAILLLGSILFIGTRPSPPAITVRHVKSVRSGDSITASFEVTNHTTTRYSFFAVFLQAHNGSMWQTCSDAGGPADVLGPHGVLTVSVVEASNVPAGYSLRLRMIAMERLTGLSRFFRRFKLWLRGRQVPLNPFDNTDFNKQTQIVSDEFVEREPTQSGQRNSEK